MPINTKTAPHRELSFNCINCLKGELDTLQTAHDAGKLTNTGNWSPGQILQHVAKFFGFAMDGFEARAPWLVRTILTLLFKKKALGPDPMPRGLKLPAKAKSLLPDESPSFEDGMSHLRAMIHRIENGNKLTHPSPIFGTLAHEQWMTIQLKHAAMHLGFLNPTT